MGDVSSSWKVSIVDICDSTVVLYQLHDLGEATQPL